MNDTRLVPILVGIAVKIRRLVVRVRLKQLVRTKLHLNKHVEVENLVVACNRPLTGSSELSNWADVGSDPKCFLYLVLGDKNQTTKFVAIRVPIGVPNPVA